MKTRHLEISRRALLAGFGATLALGASRPWPDAMYALTGQREADASALLDYFAPLQRWLREQNRGRICGW